MGSCSSSRWEPLFSSSSSSYTGNLDTRGGRGRRAKKSGSGLSGDFFFLFPPKNPLSLTFLLFSLRCASRSPREAGPPGPWHRAARGARDLRRRERAATLLPPSSSLLPLRRRLASRDAIAATPRLLLRLGLSSARRALRPAALPPRRTRKSAFLCSEEERSEGNKRQSEKAERGGKT